jgi:hypothetical protein
VAFRDARRRHLPGSSRVAPRSWVANPVAGVELHSTWRSRHIGAPPSDWMRAKTVQAGPSDEEQRIRALPDSARRYLTALNSGGIGVSFAVAGALAPNGVEPRWVIWPVVAFVVGS